MKDPHTQIAVGLEQFVILTRVTFHYRDSLSVADESVTCSAIASHNAYRFGAHASRACAHIAPLPTPNRNHKQEDALPQPTAPQNPEFGTVVDSLRPHRRHRLLVGGARTAEHGAVMGPVG